MDEQFAGRREGYRRRGSKSHDGSRLWKTLGILWERGADVLTFRLPERVFDPLGCLAPYTEIIRAEIPVADLEGRIARPFQDRSEPSCRPVEVNQVLVEDITRLELHGFADASGNAYGAGVREIQELSSPDSRRHCPTEENPADLLSGGCSFHQLSSETLWWSGPGWLLLAETLWPDMKVKRYQDYGEAEKEGRRSALDSGRAELLCDRDRVLPAFHQQCAAACGVTEIDAWMDGSGDRRGRSSVDSTDPGGGIRQDRLGERQDEGTEGVLLVRR
ncbi:Phenol 2-monooxygenase [Trichinella pseudospiralis]